MGGWQVTGSWPARNCRAAVRRQDLPATNAKGARPRLRCPCAPRPPCRAPTVFGATYRNGRKATCSGAAPYGSSGTPLPPLVRHSSSKPLFLPLPRPHHVSVHGRRQGAGDGRGGHVEQVGGTLALALPLARTLALALPLLPLLPFLLLPLVRHEGRQLLQLCHAKPENMSAREYCAVWRVRAGRSEGLCCMCSWAAHCCQMCTAAFLLPHISNTVQIRLNLVLLTLWLGTPSSSGRLGKLGSPQREYTPNAHSHHPLVALVQHHQPQAVQCRHVEQAVRAHGQQAAAVGQGGQRQALVAGLGGWVGVGGGRGRGRRTVGSGYGLGQG